MAYQKTKKKDYYLTVDLEADRDIIQRMDAQPNKAAYLKCLVREDIKRNPDKAE